MRIAYFANVHNRENNKITVEEIKKAYIIGENKLMCDGLAFWIEDKNIQDLLMSLFKDGYLDLRFASCGER